MAGSFLTVRYSSMLHQENRNSMPLLKMFLEAIEQINKWGTLDRDVYMFYCIASRMKDFLNF